VTIIHYISFFSCLCKGPVDFYHFCTSMIFFQLISLGFLSIALSANHSAFLSFVYVISKAKLNTKLC
jgi:hypothetical protein